MTIRIHVAAAVIQNKEGEILIAKRPHDKHQGGLWEFPGGKVEADENTFDALTRELHEELGITISSARPLIQIHHDYPDKSIFLDVFQVNDWRGAAYGKEKQTIQWVKPEELKRFEFPEANKPIITSTQLPSHYLITPEPEDTSEFYQSLKDALSNKIQLMQLRFKKENTHLREIVRKTMSIAAETNTIVMLNAPIPIEYELGTDGRHLTSQQLLSLSIRPGIGYKYLSASCHTKKELKHAEHIGVEFTVIAPVLKTSSHPDTLGLGWEKFGQLANNTNSPCYALGGMTDNHLETAQQHGAQGIAGISFFWVKKKG